MTELILKNKVKEQGVVDIIISYKKDMDFLNVIEKRKQWIKRERELKEELEFATDHIHDLEKYLKKTCKHTDVTEYIHFDSSRSYNCNICDCNIMIHDDFDYKNITHIDD